MKQKRKKGQENKKVRRKIISKREWLMEAKDKMKSDLRNTWSWALKHCEDPFFHLT